MRDKKKYKSFKHTCFAIIFCSIYLNICYVKTVKNFNLFSINLLQKTIEKKGHVNIALSPIPIWCLLGLVEEVTLYDLSVKPLTDLYIIEYDHHFFDDYNELLGVKGTPEAGWKIDHNVYVNNNKELEFIYNDFGKVLDNFNVQQLNLAQSKETSRKINEKIEKQTQGIFRDLISVDDLTDVALILTNIFNFKAKWQINFNNVVSRPYFGFNIDETNTEIIKIELMCQFDEFPYINMERIKAEVLELGYGMDKNISMVLLLPYVGATIMDVLKLMKNTSFEIILKELNEKKLLEVGLPNFNIQNTLEMNEILADMGIANIFDEEHSNLQLVKGQTFYITNITQKSEIEVKHGTSIPNKVLPYQGQTIIRFTKSFLYFIVNKEKNNILFAGQVTNPSNLMA